MLSTSTEQCPIKRRDRPGERFHLATGRRQQAAPSPGRDPSVRPAARRSRFRHQTLPIAPGATRTRDLPPGAAASVTRRYRTPRARLERATCRPAQPLRSPDASHRPGRDSNARPAARRSRFRHETLPIAPGATRTRDLPLRRRLLDSGTTDGPETCDAAFLAPSYIPSSSQQAIAPDANLALVMRAWSSLSVDMRQAIVALTRATVNASQDVAPDRARRTRRAATVRMVRHRTSHPPDSVSPQPGFGPSRSSHSLKEKS